MAVSLQTIADETGFSRSTVGHVLAGKGDELKLARQTQQTVLAAARRLGYRPSFFASSLRKGRSDLIIVLGSSTNSAWRAERQKLTTQVLFDAGHRVQYLDWRWGRDQSRRFVELLADLRPQGMIVSEVTPRQAPMLAQLKDEGTVLVSGDGPPGGPPELEIDGVHLDRQEVGRLAMHHLLELGHRRIACTQWRATRAWELRDRAAGYRRAVKEAGLPRNVLRYVWFQRKVESPSEDFANGYEAAGALLALKPRPTGVVASNDAVAIGMLKACADRGILVPEDLSIIGAEDHTVGAYLPQPLTTLRFPIERMAQTATTLLQQRLDSSTASLRHLPVMPALVVRATTAPPGKAAPDHSQSASQMDLTSPRSS